MPTQPKSHRDIDDLIAAMGLREEQALVEIADIAESATEPLFTGYDMRKPRPRTREPVAPDEFVDTRIGRNGPRGKHCLFLGTTLFPNIIWTDLALRDEAYWKLLEAWRQWLAPVAEWRNMWLGDTSLRAAEASATPPQGPAPEPEIASEKVSLVARGVELRRSGLSYPSAAGALFDELHPEPSEQSEHAQWADDRRRFVRNYREKISIAIKAGRSS